MTPTRSVSQFDELYDAHRATLHAYFLGRTGDAELALDLLQEVFLRAWRSIQTLEALPAERRHYWLFAIARNLVVDVYRKRGAADAANARLLRLAPPEPAAAPERDALEHEQQAE